MKIAITGGKGYVGRHLLTYPDTHIIRADIQDYGELKEEVLEILPDFIVHLAAKSNVEYCEGHKREANEVNFWGTAHVAEVCKRFNIPSVLLSTFQVFPGNRWWLKSYKEKDEPKPLNYYGMTKLVAESVCSAYSNMKIIRTGYLFNEQRLMPYINTLKDQQVEFPTFQYRNFTHLHHFCDSLMYDYIPKFDRLPKILHMGGSDTVSWFQFMKEVAQALDLHEPLPRSKEDVRNGYISRPHKAGLNVKLSYSFDFQEYSYKDGIQLLK